MHDGKGWHNLRTNPCIILLVTLFIIICFKSSWAATTNLGEEKVETSEIQQKVVIEPSAEDKAISKRLNSILKATKWFENISVKVDDGVVFLNGEAKTDKHKEWASNLANKTEDVVAVVNNIDIPVASPGEFQQQLIEAFQEQWIRFLNLLPYIIFSLIILISFWIAARLSAALMRKSFKKRGLHPLLSEVISKGVAVFCFLIGLYFVLRILGLSNIAITLLGGTGVLGIILGFAFRDISENIMASVLLSLQSPFQNGDLVQIRDITGYMQKITLRTTILMTLDGHIVQIPNAIVYKNSIYNFSNNPNRREFVVVGIGYEESISAAQDIALKVLSGHPAVLNDPEPLVLVQDLTPDTVNLRVYFWFDGNKHNWLKMKSSVIRLVKRSFHDHDISMPGREIDVRVKENIPIKVLSEQQLRSSEKNAQAQKQEASTIATHAEGSLSSEADDIQRQVKQSGAIDKEADLLLRPDKPSTN